MNLTDTKARNAKPQEKDYRLSDGHGLHLFVRTNGAKLWRWRYEFKGRKSYVVWCLSAGDNHRRA